MNQIIPRIIKVQIAWSRLGSRQLQSLCDNDESANFVPRGVFQGTWMMLTWI